MNQSIHVNKSTPTPSRRGIYGASAGFPFLLLCLYFSITTTFQVHRNDQSLFSVSSKDADSIPTVNAGPDEKIPVGQATVLHGEKSKANGDKIVSFQWVKSSGPAQYEILNPDAAATWIRKMTRGVYVYRLTVTTSKGYKSSDDVTITVTGPNQAPSISAGKNQTIIPASTVQLEGSASDDDGSIVTYQWTQVSGKTATINSPNAAVTTISGLATAGTRKFRLTVTDNEGAKSVADVFVFVQDGGVAMNKIPMDYRRFYTLVNNTYDAEKLFDGDLKNKYSPGAGLIYEKTGFEARYQFPEEMDVTISRLRMYDDKYSYADKPIRIYAITDNETMDSIYIGSFDGRVNEGWNVIDLPRPIQDVKYLVFRGGKWDNWPVELEVYGSASTYNEVLPDRNHNRFRDLIGMNIYEWNFLQNKVHPFVSWQIYEPAWDILKHITHFRHYIDWSQIEGEEGNYSFQPTRRGAWFYDEMYKQASSQGHTITPCIKAIPDWMINYLPKNVGINRPNEANPVKYPAPLDSLSSYLPAARTYFQFAARYGSTKVNPGMLSVYSPPGYTKNEVKSGLGYVKYMEAENEKDRWWIGGNDGKDYGYMNGRQYAAFLSMIYDGHMGRFGPGVGIKAADPKMKLTLGGTANPLTDYFRGIVDWCHEFRNDSLPFDWNVYHDYATDGSASQGAHDAKSGLCPELSKLSRHAENQVFATEIFANKGRSYKRGLINSEFGYDTDPWSSLYAKPIGEKDTYLVQADWMIRTFLLYWEYGLDRTFYFQFYDNAENSPGIFGTSGVANANLTKRPSLDFIQQVLKALGDVDTFDIRLSAQPRVFRSRNASGTKTKYVGWMPTMNDSRSVYSYQLSNPANRVKLYTLTAGQSDAVVSFLPAGQTANIPISETPVIWEEVPAVYKLTTPTVNAGADQVINLPLADSKTPIILAGTGSNEKDTVSFQWSKISGPGYPFIETPYRAKTNLYYVTNGEYVFELKAINADGQTVTDQVKIVVNNAPGNKAPVAVAGNDTILVAPTTHYLLNGSRSKDDLGITSYTWRKIQGPSWGSISNVNAVQNYVYNMDPGHIYKFELTVTDAAGASSADTVIVITLKKGERAPTKVKPVANAGPDRVIVYPADSAMLDGSKSADPDGSVVSYKWEKIKGPGHYKIANASSPTTMVTELDEGEYEFRLTITDNNGEKDEDIVKVSVIANPAMQRVYVGKTK